MPQQIIRYRGPARASPWVRFCCIAGVFFVLTFCSAAGASEGEFNVTEGISESRVNAIPTRTQRANLMWRIGVPSQCHSYEDSEGLPAVEDRSP